MERFEGSLFTVECRVFRVHSGESRVHSLGLRGFERRNEERARKSENVPCKRTNDLYDNVQDDAVFTREAFSYERFVWAYSGTNSAIGLRACYAVSGTDRAYRAIPLRGTEQAHTATCLRACYGVSCTDQQNTTMQLCARYVVFGTALRDTVVHDFELATGCL
eukprot:3123472-Rhodomonas_salina.1